MTLENVIAIGQLVAIIFGTAAAIKKLTETHNLMNSRMTELLELARDAAYAQGVKAGEKHDTE